MRGRLIIHVYPFARKLLLPIYMKWLKEISKNNSSQSMSNETIIGHPLGILG
jgi:hypothetical protein